VVLRMKRLPVRWLALLCLVASAAVAASALWSIGGHVLTEDHNGDGRPDTWRRYDNRGQLTEVDVDSNFDGNADIEEFYKQGALVRRESDRNFNGQTDLVEEFDTETHGQIRSVVDTDYDGTADLLLLFRDGQPIFSERAHSSQRSSLGTAIPPAFLLGGTGHLARVIDPFEAETAIRARPTVSTNESYVGLSTSGGLPCPRGTALSGLVPLAQLVARDVQPDALTLFLPRSPRAPPVS